MENITNRAALRLAIQQLEEKQLSQGEELKNHFDTTLESLKPVNLFKSTLNDIVSTPFFSEHLSGTIIGVAGGCLTKKVVTGKSDNAFRKILGTLLQHGVTNAISNNPEVIKTAGDVLYRYIHNKIYPDPEADDQE